MSDLKRPCQPIIIEEITARQRFEMEVRVKTMYDLIIIGSGPAGLSAAVYGRRAGFSTLVIEKNPMSGG